VKRTTLAHCARRSNSGPRCSRGDSATHRVVLVVDRSRQRRCGRQRRNGQVGTTCILSGNRQDGQEKHSRVAAAHERHHHPPDVDHSPPFPGAAVFGCTKQMPGLQGCIGNNLQKVQSSWPSMRSVFRARRPKSSPFGVERSICRSHFRPVVHKLNIPSACDLPLSHSFYVC